MVRSTVLFGSGDLKKLRMKTSIGMYTKMVFGWKSASNGLGSFDWEDRSVVFFFLYFVGETYVCVNDVCMCYNNNKYGVPLLK